MGVGSGGGSARFLERCWQLREPHRTERGEPLAQGNFQLPNAGEPHRAHWLHRKEIHETEGEQVRLGYYPTYVKLGFTPLANGSWNA